MKDIYTLIAPLQYFIVKISHAANYQKYLGRTPPVQEKQLTGFASHMFTNTSERIQFEWKDL